MTAYTYLIWGVLFLLSLNPAIKIMDGINPDNFIPIERTGAFGDNPDGNHFQPLNSAFVDYNSTRSNK